MACRRISVIARRGVAGESRLLSGRAIGLTLLRDLALPYECCDRSECSPGGQFAYLFCGSRG